MHYELQCLIVCPDDHQRCTKDLMEVAHDLNDKLKRAGLSFVVEVRDLRAGRRLYRAIDGSTFTGL